VVYSTLTGHAQREGGITVTENNPLIDKVESVTKSKFYKIFELFQKLIAPGTFLVSLWHSYSHAGPGEPFALTLAKATWLSLMACGSLGLGLAGFLLLRSFLLGKGPLSIFDWIFAIPISVFLFLFVAPPAQSIFMVWITLGLGCLSFLILVLFPTLHKLRLIDLTKPPPWQKRD
jgi:hypothetical protein